MLKIVTKVNFVNTWIIHGECLVAVPQWYSASGCSPVHVFINLGVEYCHMSSPSKPGESYQDTKPKYSSLVVIDTELSCTPLTWFRPGLRLNPHDLWYIFSCCLPTTDTCDTRYQEMIQLIFYNLIYTFYWIIYSWGDGGTLATLVPWVTGYYNVTIFAHLHIKVLPHLSKIHQLTTNWINFNTN